MKFLRGSILDSPVSSLLFYLCLIFALKLIVWTAKEVREDKSISRGERTFVLILYICFMIFTLFLILTALHIAGHRK